VVLIRDGIYREEVTVTNSGTETAPIIFEAAPVAHVVVTGADALNGWQKVPGDSPIYRLPWPYKFNGWTKTMTHPDDDYHRLIGRCEQVVIDGYLLRQVLTPEQLAPGTFLADIAGQTLEVWDAGNRNMNQVSAEGSVRQELLHVSGSYVQVRGLHFRYAANMAQHGAVLLEGAHNTLEDCTMESMNSSGATFSGPGHVVRRCVFRQLGFGAAAAHDLLFTDCLVENNNTKNFDRGWEAGGDKLVLSRHAILENSRFLRNHGNGIWFDIGNEDCEVRNCLIADNDDSGIFDEISFGLYAHDNVIVANGFAATAGAWGAQAGISLSSSPDSRVEHNLILGNREGFNFREQTRTTVRIGGNTEQPVWNHDQTIDHNIIAYNRDAQIWGWFDMNDGRQWPAKKTEASPTPGTTADKPADIAGRYNAKDDHRQPTGLSLKKLNLRFADNVYFADVGQGGFEWGVAWSHHKSYARLADFQTGLGIDHDSRVIEPAFANFSALDLRLAPEAMGRLKPDYPQGTVPGVVLGTDVK
jgi:hypothetical protein